jgi:hypothetical protein
MTCSLPICLECTPIVLWPMGRYVHGSVLFWSLYYIWYTHVVIKTCPILNACFWDHPKANRFFDYRRYEKRPWKQQVIPCWLQVSECPPLHDFLPSCLWFPMCYLFKSSGILTCGDIKILLKFHFRILRILNFRQICSREWKGSWRNYTILPNFLMVLTGTNTTYQSEEGGVGSSACLSRSLKWTKQRQSQIPDQQQNWGYDDSGHIFQSIIFGTRPPPPSACAISSPGRLSRFGPTRKKSPVFPHNYPLWIKQGNFGKCENPPEKKVLKQCF